MLEKDIVSKIRRYLASYPACFSWKEHGGMYGTAGIPDIICSINGRFVAFEVKTATNRPSSLQRSVINRIRECGGTAEVVRSVEEVKSVLEKLGGVV